MRVGVRHRDHLAFVNSLEHSLALAPANQRNVVRHEAVRGLQIDEVAAIAIEERLRRNPGGVIDGFHGDHKIRSHAGAQLGSGLIEGDAGFEMTVPGGAGRSADVLDMAGERFAGERHHRYVDLLSLRKMAAVEFSHIRAHLPVLHVGNLRDGHARACRIAELKREQLHSPKNNARAERIGQDVNVAAALRLQGHAVDNALIGSHGDLGLVERGLLDDDAGFGIGLLIDQVLLGLVKAILRGFHGQIVLAGHDGWQQRIAAHFQLREFKVGLSLQVCHLRLFLSGIAGGLGLNHLLFGLGLIGLGFAEIVFLLRGIELHHGVAGRDQFSRFAELSDGERIDAGHRGDQRFRVAALQFAARRDRDDDLALFHPRSRQIGLDRNHSSGSFGYVQRAPRAGGSNHSHQPEKHQNPFHHFVFRHTFSLRLV